MYSSCTVTERKSEVAREFGARSCGLGWGDARLDSMKGMSNTEVQYMLKNCALEGNDQDVSGGVGGVGGAAKAVCVKRAG